MNGGKFSIVQIGAHLGDEARETIKEGKACLLVEPVPFLFSALLEKYANNSNVLLEQAVVSDEPGEVNFYYFPKRENLENSDKFPFWTDQIGSLDQSHLIVLGRQSGFPQGFEKQIISQKIQSMSTMQLFKKHGIKIVEKLIIDTEGFDVDIIFSIDFHKIEIDDLVFERKHTDGVRQTRYRYNKTVHFLKSLGYQVKKLDHQNDIATLRSDWKKIRTRKHRSEQLKQAKLWRCKLSQNILSFFHRKKEESLLGVVYLAIGIDSFHELQSSMATLLKSNPSVPITVFTDQSPRLRFPANYIPMDHDKSPFKLKVSAMGMSPYKYTIYLDTDTFIVKSLQPVFDLLSVHDFCMANGPAFSYDNDGRYIFNNYSNEKVLNTGVLGFKRSEKIRSVFEFWEESMKHQEDSAISAGSNCDQAYFNRLVKSSKVFEPIDFVVLDNVSWNLRTYALGQALKEGRMQEVHIIHGKVWEAEQFWGINLDELVSQLIA